MTNPDYRALCAELHKELEKRCELSDFVNTPEEDRLLDRSAAALRAALAHPTPQPVAVSERLPGPEDCDAEGRCWLGGHQMGSETRTWLLGYPAWAERFPDVHHFWLPAHALPIPEAING